jgi:hypothetical protein
VTFVVDTTSQADGKQKLAEVKPGEQVFLVGEFNGWNPQDPKYAMTEVPNQPGKYSITLQFPLETSSGPIDTGAELQYKYAKTTDQPGTDVWGNGVKDFFQVDATHPCTNAPTEKAGLFELKENLKLTIPATATELPAYVVPAWRDYAQSLGYKTCN